MKKRLIAVCDSDKKYLERLQENLESNRGFPFSVDTYTDTEKLNENLKEREYELILAAGEAFEKLKDKGTASLVLLKEPGRESFSGKTVKKYQSADGIRREILGLCADSDSIAEVTSEERKTTVIGVYSPAGRDLQTAFSLLTGQLLAKKKRVLYLNMEPFSGFKEMLDSKTDRDLTDLIYYLLSGRDKLKYKLESLVGNVGGLDYVSPAFSFVDLTQVSKENWLLLINTLVSCGNYDYLILDLSEIVQGLLNILAMCDVIYTISSRDEIGKAKIKEYEALLESEELDHVLERMRRFEVPETEDLPLEPEELPYSKLAPHVKRLLKESGEVLNE